MIPVSLALAVAGFPVSLAFAITVPVLAAIAVTMCILVPVSVTLALGFAITVSFALSIPVAVTAPVTMSVSATIALSVSATVTMSVSAAVAVARILTVRSVVAVTAIIGIVPAVISGVGSLVPSGPIQFFLAQIAIVVAICAVKLNANRAAQLPAEDHAIAVQIVDMEGTRVDGAQIGRAATMAPAAGSKGDSEVFVAENHADIWPVIVAATATFQTTQ